MPAKLYRVNLTQDEREHLLGVTRRGKSSGRKVKRALILCKADEGLTDQQVAEALMVGPSTVGRVRQRFVEGGLERALNDLPRPGQRRKLDGKQEAHLVAVACSAAMVRMVANPAQANGQLPVVSRPSTEQGTRTSSALLHPHPMAGGRPHRPPPGGRPQGTRSAGCRTNPRLSPPP